MSEKTNLGRVLTIRVTITDPEAAKWIWDAHKESDHKCGVRVGALFDGDLFEEHEKFEDCLDRLLDNYDDEFCWDIQDELEEFERQQIHAIDLEKETT